MYNHVSKYINNMYCIDVYLNITYSHLNKLK